MPLKDPNLNGALEDIFAELARNPRRAGSVPPLATTDSSTPSKKGGPSKQSRTPGPSSSSSNQKPDGETTTEPRRTVSFFAAPTKKKPEPKNTRSTSSKVQRRKLPPLRDSFMKDDPNICTHGTTRIHSQFCSECAARVAERRRTIFTDCEKQEENSRLQLRAIELAAFVKCRDDCLIALEDERRRSRDARRKSLAKVDRALEADHEIHRNALFREERLERRSLRGNYEVEFDEIGAQLKLTLRLEQQVRDMRQKHEARRKQLDAEEKDKTETESRERWETMTTRERAHMEEEENLQRLHIDRCFVSVFKAVYEVFSSHRTSIMQHENRVANMMARHRLKVAALQAEEVKLVQDEVVARERVYASERKNWDNTVCMEPDLRRRANVAAANRVRRETRDRGVLELAESDAREDLQQEAVDEFAALQEEQEANHERVTTNDARRSVLLKRRRWRENRESGEHEKMMAEEDRTWAVVRYEFETTLSYLCIQEEAADRRGLVAQKMADVQRITDNVRARARMTQCEERLRSEILRSEQAVIAEVIARIHHSGYVTTSGSDVDDTSVSGSTPRHANAQYSPAQSPTGTGSDHDANLVKFFLYESYMRQSIVSEWNVLVADEIMPWGEASKWSAAERAMHPRTKPLTTDFAMSERKSAAAAGVLADPVPGSDGYIIPHCSLLTWFHGTQPLPLLGSAVVAPPEGMGSSTSSPLTEGSPLAVARSTSRSFSVAFNSMDYVSDIQVHAKLLNPLDGDYIDIGALNVGTTDAIAGSGGPRLSLSTRAPSQSRMLTSVTPVPSGGPAAVAAPSLDFVFSGSLSVLFDNLSFCSSAPYSRRHWPLRVVTVSVENYGSCTLYISTAPPLFAPSTQFVAVGAASAPFRHLSLPQASRVKAARFVLQIFNASPTAASDRLEFSPPSDCSVHPKQGITKNGASVLRVLNQSPSYFEAEFDNLPNIPVRHVLSNVILQRADTELNHDPLLVQWYFTLKDDSVIEASSKIAVDVAVGNMPRLRLNSSDLALRTHPQDLPGKFNHILPPCYQHLFPYSSIALAEDHVDVMGGGFTISIGGDADGKIGLGIQPFGLFNRMTLVHGNDKANTQVAVVEEEGTYPVAAEPLELWCYSEESDERGEKLGVVIGAGSSRLQCVLDAQAALSPEQITALLRSIVALPHRALSVRGSKTYPVKVCMDLNKTARGDTIVAEMKLSVLPPLAETRGKNNGFSYREGQGKKVFPTIELKSGALKLGPEARIEVEIVSGFEISDRLDVLEKHFDEGEDMYVFRHKSTPVAWWLEPSEETPQKIVFYLSGEHALKDWMRSAITDPYGAESAYLSDGSADVLAGLGVFLHSICYECTSSAPKQLKKEIRWTFDDGRTGRTTLPFELTIESVDDPTELQLESKTRTYQQLHSTSRFGFQLMPDAELFDPDSDNFHGGYASVDHTLPTGDIGDHLSLLTVEQQELLIHSTKKRGVRPSLAIVLEDSGVNAAQVPLLDLLQGECPRRLLYNDEVGRKLRFGNDWIGSYTVKTSGGKDNANTTAIRINFSSEGKFVPFDVVEYVLQCIAYENTSPKMREGDRHYSIRLNCTGTKATTETVEKITVSTSLALMSTPAPTLRLRFEEGGKARPLLKQVVTALKVETLSHAGFLRVQVVNAVDPSDEILFESTPEIKVKERSLFFGKELAAVVARREPGQSLGELQVSFGKVNNQSLQAVLRALCFINRAGRMESYVERKIDIHCSASSEEHVNSIRIVLSVTAKTNTADWSLHTTRVLVMHRRPVPTSVLKGTTLKEADDKVFPDGSQLTFEMKHRMPGEFLVLCSTELITVKASLSADEDKTERKCWVDLIFEGLVIATAPHGGYVNPALVADPVFSGTMVLTLCETNRKVIASLLECVGYVNRDSHESVKGFMARRQLVVSLKPKGCPPTTSTIGVDLVPPVADFSDCPSLITVLAQTLVSIGTTCGIEMSSLTAIDARYVVLQATLRNFADTDSLEFHLPQDCGLLLGSDETTIFHANDKKKLPFAKVSFEKTEIAQVLNIRCDAVPSSSVPMRALLSSIQIICNATLSMSLDTSRRSVVDERAALPQLHVLAECFYGSTEHTFGIAPFFE